MFFSSARVKREFANNYISVIEQLTDNYDFYDIETSFGNVNIIEVSDKKDLPSIMLFHGMRGAGPLFLKNLLPLRDKFRLLIVDSLEGIDLDYSNALDGKNYEHGQWIFEIMARMNLKDVVLTGVSIGAVSVLNALAFDDRKIRGAILISPAGLTTKTGSFNYKLKLNRYLGLNSMLVWNDKLKGLAEELITEPSSFTYEYIEKFISRFNFSIPKIGSISQDMSIKIKSPVYLLVGEKDKLFSHKHMQSTAERQIPSLLGSKALKGQKHFIGLEAMEQEMKRILSDLF